MWDIIKVLIVLHLLSLIFNFISVMYALVYYDNRKIQRLNTEETDEANKIALSKIEPLVEVMQCDIMRDPIIRMVFLFIIAPFVLIMEGISFVLECDRIFREKIN